mgnify:CR=1 FL=1
MEQHKFQTPSLQILDPHIPLIIDHLHAPVSYLKTRIYCIAGIAKLKQCLPINSFIDSI